MLPAPGLRVLYLAPARLVSNVGREFKRLSLFFREWKAQDGDAQLETDSRIIASIIVRFTRIISTVC